MSDQLKSAIQDVADEPKFSRWMDRAFVVAKNTGICVEDESLAIAEQLRVLHQITDGDASRQKRLKTTAELFLKYFASLNHKAPSVSVAEIVGDLYANEGDLSAVHFYCFSFTWAEQCHLPEESLFRLLHKLEKLEQTYYFGLIRSQYDASQFTEGWFDDQLHSLRTSPDKFAKMIDHFVSASSAAYSDATDVLIEDMAYSLVSRISQETWRIPEKWKKELTNKVLSLRTPPQGCGPVSYETHRIARRRHSLQALRRSIVDVRQFPCDEEMSMQLWCRGVKGIVSDMIDEVVSILGEPRQGIDFAVIAMGSFGRGESSAFSDLEMAIVYKRSGLQREVVLEYLRVFSTLLWLRIVMLMEDNSKIEHMRCGIKLDSSFSFSPEGARPLIMEVSEMVSEFEKGELILSNQLARTCFVWGQEAVALEMQTHIQQLTPALAPKLVVETLQELLQQYKVIYREDAQREGFNVKEEIRLITLFVQVVGVHGGVFEASTISCLRTLVHNQHMHKGLAQALKTALLWLWSLRYDMHIFYGRECDEFLPTMGHPTATTARPSERYVLTPAQRRKWFLFSPIVTNLVLQLIDGILLTTTAQQEGGGGGGGGGGVATVLLATLDPQTLDQLANYFVLQHEDELWRFREHHGLSMHSRIDHAAYWKDPIILRANYYFEAAVLCSVEGTQSAFEHLVSKFFHQVGPLCSIREEYQEQYLTAQPEVYGRRRVIPLSSEVHLKVFPELPGQECLASEIAHRITGYTTSFSCLRKYANRKPVLISKTVIGINLQTLLTQQATALETLVDPENFSWQFIRTLLLNPEDDKPDNFMVMALFDEWTGQERCKLVCVDNDHTLSEPVVKGLVWNELLVKSIVLCSREAMDRPVHPQVIAWFTACHVEELVIRICDALIAADDAHCRQFTRAEWSQESFDEWQQKIECKIPMFVSEEAAVRLLVKLKTLKALMENDPEITHRAIMTHASLEPVVGKIYEKARHQAAAVGGGGSTEDCFAKVTSGLYKIVGHTRMTVSNSEKMLRSSLGKAPTKEQIEQRVLYTPRQMRTKFFSVLPQQLTSQVARVRRALLAMDPHAKQLYYDLTDDVAREEVISGRQWTNGESEPGIKFDTLNGPQQQFIIQLLKKQLPGRGGLFFAQGKRHSFLRLVLRHCSTLTDRDLLKILAQSPSLQVLDVRDCGQLTDAALANIPHVCPRLRVFLKDTRPNVSNLLSMVLSAARWFGDDAHNNADMDIQTSIELLDSALTHPEDALAKRMGYLALGAMNIDPDHLKAQAPDQVARLFTCAVRMSIDTSDDVTQALLVRVTVFFLSICLAMDSDLPLGHDLVVEYARLVVLRLADPQLREALSPTEVLLLLVVDTKLLCLMAADAGQGELVDDLIATFALLQPRLPTDSAVDGSDGLISVWVRIIANTSAAAAARLPQSMVDFALEVWYRDAQTRRGLCRTTTDDSKLIMMLPKLLYTYRVSSSILLFLLESLGELYVHAESDMDHHHLGGGGEGEEGGMWQNILLRLLVRYLGGRLIESQLEEVPHQALYDFVQRAKEHRAIILASPKATLCMAFHAAFIAKTLCRPDTYGFLLFMVAKALSLPMFPKSKRSDLSDALKRYLHAQSHWMTDDEVRDVCGACLALRAQRVDIVATSVCLWLRRASLHPPSPAQLCLLLTMMAAWRRRSAMRLWMELYTPHVAAHVLAFCPSPVPASVLSALEQLLLPLSELADRDEAGDEDDDEEAAAEAAAAAAAAAAVVTQTTHATDQPVFDVADVIVAADAHAIVAAPVNAIVLGPVEFPIDHVAGPAVGASTAAASAAAATITTTTTEDVIAEAIDQWAVKNATTTATATVAAAEAEDVADEEVVRDTPRNAAIVQLVHRVFRPQIAMLLLQRCPHYTGSLLLPPPAAGAGAGAGPSPRSAQEMGDAMVDALTALVARARKVADADGEGQGDGAGGEPTTTTTSTSTSPDEGDHCSEWTGEDQFKALCQYLGQGLVVDGFSPAQLTRLFSTIASVMTDPEQYTAECCDTATRCCIDIVDRGQLPGHCVSLVIQAAITATRRDPSGTNRQGLCWLLDQLVERYQPAMTSDDIDTLIEFFGSRVYTAPRDAMMATTAAAAAAATTAHTDVSPATAAGGAETFPSARQNSFVGLIKLVDGSQTNPLTRAQLKRIRDVLVECLCWDSVTFADMNQTERDEVRVLLSGEIVATLNRLIAATAAATATAGSP